jgi:hypothetical protein
LLILIIFFSLARFDFAFVFTLSLFSSLSPLRFLLSRGLCFHLSVSMRRRNDSLRLIVLSWSGVGETRAVWWRADRGNGKVEAKLNLAEELFEHIYVSNAR